MPGARPGILPERRKLSADSLPPNYHVGAAGSVVHANASDTGRRCRSVVAIGCIVVAIGWIVVAIAITIRIAIRSVAIAEAVTHRQTGGAPAPTIPVIATMVRDLASCAEQITVK